MTAIPAARAAAGPDRLTGWPPTSSSPLSGRWTPARIFTRVDLPAPFSPTERVRLAGVQDHRPVGQGLGGTERLGGVPEGSRHDLTIRGNRCWLGWCPGFFH